MAPNIKTCIGFGEFDGVCLNPPGSSHSDHWCQRCDDLRLESLRADFAALEKSFAAATQSNKESEADNG